MALIQRTVCLISQSMKRVLFVILCVLALITIATPQIYAEPLNYGPTKSGDTLWKIAKRNLPDSSLSVEQFVYSIYISNPKAFQSGNINQLLRGVTLKLPATASILKISKPEAKKQISILQTDAKQLTRAKVNTRKFNQQIKKYSRQLRKYRRNTRGWKRIYRKLARSKRNRAVSNRKIARINRSIRDRRDLMLAGLPKINETSTPVPDTTKTPSSSPVVMTEISQKEVDETNKALAKLAIEEQRKNNLQTASLKQDKSEPKANKGNPVNVPENQEIKSATITKPASVADKQKSIVSPSSTLPSTPPSSKQKINWFNYVSENLILIAGIINAIILLFVLFKLFEKKEEPDFIQYPKN